MRGCFALSGRVRVPARRCRAGLGVAVGGWRRVRLRRDRDGQREQVRPGRGGDGVPAFAGPDFLDGEPGVVPSGPLGGDEPQRVPGDVAADDGDRRAEGRDADTLSCADACWYVLARGDTRTACHLAGDLYRHWRDWLGSDHPETLVIAHYLAWALRLMGEYAAARDLDQESLTRKRRLQGE